MANRMLKWFAFAHLPVHLQPISAAFASLANELDMLLPEGAEKTAGMRKLLEAKDCMVRAQIDGVEQAAEG